MMDFQIRRHEAEQKTGRLVVLLALGVVAITAVVSVLVAAVLLCGSRKIQPLTALTIAAPASSA